VSVTIADVSGDGKADLIVANSWGENISVELGNGDGTFQDVPPTSGPAAFFFLADLDNDGTLDAVGPQPGASVEVQLGTAAGAFQASVPYATDLAARFAVQADINDDGTPDILTWGSLGGRASTSVLLGTGDGTFQSAINQPIDPDFVATATADLDADGNADVVETYAGGAPIGNVVRVRLGNGDGTFELGADYPTDDAPGQIAAADLDGDGTPDLVVLVGLDRVSVRLGRGDGSFRPGVSYAAGPTASLLTVADVSGDGKPDLLIYNGPVSSESTVRVLLGVGDGTFVTKASYPANSEVRAMVAADVTGDGVPDLVMPCFNNTVSVLPGAGDGGFRPRFELGGFALTETIAVADITGDGKPDLVVPGGPVYVGACLP